MTRWWRHFVQRAINAIADLELICEWLEMNVARAVLNRLVKNEIDKANDRCCVCFGFDCRLAVSFASVCGVDKCARLAELLENFFHARRVGAVRLFDQVFDLIRWRNNDLDVFTECKAKGLRSVKIERIDESDSQCWSAHLNRKSAV